MFTLVYGNQLNAFPILADRMFTDRRIQFKERCGWNLSVDERGRETDVYDSENPLYVIMHDRNGVHSGSTRLLPTTGPTMIADHFSNLTDGVAIQSPLVWECTRFFVVNRGPGSRAAAAALMWAGCRFGLLSGIQFYVGVTAAQMVRVFQSCGWPAEVIGSSRSAEGEICACVWEVSEALCDELADRAGIPPGQELNVHPPFAGRGNSGRVRLPAGTHAIQPELMGAEAH